METALHFGLANVVMAAVIALVAAAFSLIRRRPALSHALWLLVILKLLTPPLWGVQIDRRWVEAAAPTRAAPRERSQSLATQAVSAPPEHIAQVAPPIDVGPAAPVETEPRVEFPKERWTPPPPAVAMPASVRPADITAELANWLPLAAALVWLIGSIICGATIVVRVVRFHRLLRFAELASPALQGRAAALARRMGMARSPRVWFVPGAVSPMLWPLGRSPRVLIPSGLWGRLDEGQRRSLLAHELAHLRRRDHWVRLPEVLASVLYWWCPLTWYARRRLREAEEQCCDAWVVWAFPEAASDYASALLETVDFVAAGGRLPLPVLASGMGQFHQLRRRLVMIKHARVSRKMSGPSWLAVGALALGLLPLAPTLAQVSVSTAPAAADSKDEAPRSVEVAPAAVPTILDGVSVGLTPIAGAPVGLPPLAPTAAPPAVAPTALPPAPGAASAEVEREVDGAIINDLKSKPRPGSATPKAKKPGEGYGPDDPRLQKAREEARNQVHELSMQLKMAEQRLADLERAARKGYAEGESMKGRLAKTAPMTPPPAPGYVSLKGNYGSYGTSAYAPGGIGVARGKENPYESNHSRAERRLDAIEANLKALLQEVHSMREQQSDHAPESNLPR
jgi:beta-lactamase regulating signal transducer with metallopeptidase domain